MSVAQYNIWNIKYFIFIYRKESFVYVLQMAKVIWQDETVSGHDIMCPRQITPNGLKFRASNKGVARIWPAQSDWQYTLTLQPLQEVQRTVLKKGRYSEKRKPCNVRLEKNTLSSWSETSYGGHLSWIMGTYPMWEIEKFFSPTDKSMR